MAVVIQLRRDTAANWTSANTLLAEGEIGIELDTDLFKIGDGITAWNDLDYGGVSGLDGATGPIGPVIGTIDGGIPSTLYSEDAEALDGGTP